MKPTPELQDHYQDYYSQSDLRLKRWRELGAVCKARNIMNAAANVPHDSIIDIGAGDGAVLASLAKSNFGNQLYAAELSQSGVDLTIRRSIPALVEAKRFDGTKLPYEDGAHDLAVLSHVLEHVEHPRHLLVEAMRVAKHLYVEVPLELTVRLPMDFRWSDTGHINFYSYKSFRQLIQSTNLRVVKQLMTNISLAAHTFDNSKSGWLLFLTREAAIRVAPRMARHVFTYNSGILCNQVDAP